MKHSELVALFYDGFFAIPARDPNGVLDARKNPRRFCLFALIVARADWETGHFEISISETAKSLGIKRSTLGDDMKALIGAGYVQRVVGTTPAGRRHFVGRLSARYSTQLGENIKEKKTSRQVSGRSSADSRDDSGTITDSRLGNRENNARAGNDNFGDTYASLLSFFRSRGVAQYEDVERFQKQANSLVGTGVLSKLELLESAGRFLSDPSVSQGDRNIVFFLRRVERYRHPRGEDDTSTAAQRWRQQGEDDGGKI